MNGILFRLILSLTCQLAVLFGCCCTISYMVTLRICGLVNTHLKLLFLAREMLVNKFENTSFKWLYACFVTDQAGELNGSYVSEGLVFRLGLVSFYLYFWKQGLQLLCVSKI